MSEIAKFDIDSLNNNKTQPPNSHHSIKTFCQFISRFYNKKPLMLLFRSLVKLKVFNQRLNESFKYGLTYFTSTLPMMYIDAIYSHYEYENDILRLHKKKLHNSKMKEFSVSPIN